MCAERYPKEAMFCLIKLLLKAELLPLLLGIPQSRLVTKKCGVVENFWQIQRQFVTMLCTEKLFGGNYEIAMWNMSKTNLFTF